MVKIVQNNRTLSFTGQGKKGPFSSLNQVNQISSVFCFRSISVAVGVPQVKVIENSSHLSHFFNDKTYEIEIWKKIFQTCDWASQTVKFQTNILIDKITIR